MSWEIGVIVSRNYLPAADPTPSPTPDVGGALTMSGAGVLLAVVFFLGSIAVIAIALAFAFQYHAKLLDVINTAAKSNSVRIGSESSTVGALAGTPQIEGPEAGAPSAKLEYSLAGVDPGTTISWTAVGGDPASGNGAGFATRFDSAGTHEVSVEYSDAQNVTQSLTKNVVIAEKVSGPPTIVLPFVIKNWGRLVVVILGVGTVAALMALRIIGAEAGVAILGSLLGFGVATATSGTTGGKPGGDPQDLS